MFVNYSGTKEAFIAAGLATTYANKIVFIKGGASGKGKCIYTHGNYFGNFAELIAALNYVIGVNVGGQSYNAAQGGGYIAFGAKDPSTVAVNAGQNGVEIGLTEEFTQSVDEVIALADAINKDYLKAADKTALENLITTAKSEAKSEAIAEVKGSADTDTKDSLTIQGVRKYVDDKTSGIASDAVVSGISDRVKAIEDDYLKNTDKEALQSAINTEKDRVDAIAADYLKAADKTELSNSIKAISDDYLKAADKTELANRITNEAPVTMSEAAGSGDILKTYTFTQNGKEIGKINLAKDLVVSGGQVVEKDGVKYLQLTIANQSDPVEIAVSDLVDVYTGSEFVSISDGNVISVDKAGIIAGLATEDYVDDKIADEVTRADAAYDTKGAATAAQSAAESKAAELASDAEAAAKSYADGEVAKAKTYAEEKATAAQTAAQSYADGLSANYATAAQGAKADTAAQQATTYTKDEVDAMWAWEEL